MVPHLYQRPISVAEVTFNRHLRRGRSAVENAFGILKHTFRELLLETELSVVFLPDVIFCCAILHNILLGQYHDEVEQLLSVLREEGLAGEGAGVQDFGGIVPERTATAEAVEKRAALGLFVVTQRPCEVQVLPFACIYAGVRLAAAAPVLIPLLKKIGQCLGRSFSFTGLKSGIS